MKKIVFLPNVYSWLVAPTIVASPDNYFEKLYWQQYLTRISFFKSLYYITLSSKRAKFRYVSGSVGLNKDFYEGFFYLRNGRGVHSLLGKMYRQEQLTTNLKQQRLKQKEKDKLKLESSKFDLKGFFDGFNWTYTS